MSRAASTRPGTARPASTRPGTAMGGRASTVRGEEVGDWVVALMQGRSGGLDVGVASFCLTTGRTVLTQIADSTTFARTLHHISLRPPIAVLVPDTALSAAQLREQGLVATGKTGWRGGGGGAAAAKKDKDGEASVLVQLVEDVFGLEVTGMPRRYWDKQAGQHFIVDYIVEDEQRAGVVMAATAKYYTLCAAAALFKHIETTHDLTFLRRSLKISYEAPEGTMLIDHETAKNLELVSNALDSKSRQSLFGVLNRTTTKMGARLLRGSIMQPSTVEEVVQTRLDAVQELIQSEEVFAGIKAGLKPFKNDDLERLVAQITQTTVKADPRNIEARVSHLLTLKSIVRALPGLIEGLALARSDLILKAQELLADERLGRIDELISLCLNEDAAAGKGKAQNVKATRIYAVQANFNKMLDIARETYKENVEDVYKHRQDCQDKFGLDLELAYRDNGFYLTLRAKDDNAQRIPREFRNVAKKGNKWHMTSPDLLKLNARAKDTAEEIFLMSADIITELNAAVAEHISCLYGVSDSIARLDMLMSFAEVAMANRYVRPEFTGTLAIKNGRHPILDKTLAMGQCVGNDTYAAENQCSFQLIQGANMSGKSTYLRQVGLLAVMAMCGSYVPATYATFRYHDALLSRLSNDDSIEKCLSTFAAEMATSSMILGLATRDSLVLVDELGRGTAPAEGVGIAHAIAEALTKSKAFVFFTTHFKELATTLGNYPTVELLHLHSHRKTRDPSAEFSMTFSHKVVKGRVRDEQYGLELAKLAALPEDVMTVAKQVSDKLSGWQRQGEAASESKAIAMRRKALLTLRSELQQVVTVNALAEPALRVHLKKLQDKAISALIAATQQRNEALQAIAKRAEEEQSPAGNVLE